MSRGLLSVIAAYLIAGIPFGLILYRIARGADIRSTGSGNIGATNVARSAGWAMGIATLILDAAKGAAAVWIARAATGDVSWEAGAALAAVAGHCFPIYLGFRGGKGVATGCGAFALLDPTAMGIALAIFLLVAGLTRMVSAGSVVAAIAFPIAAAATGLGFYASIWAALAGLLIVVRHHENLRRILSGEERKIGAPRERPGGGAIGERP